MIMSIPENQIQDTLAAATATQPTVVSIQVPTLDQVTTMTKGDLEKLETDLKQAANDLTSGISAIAQAKEAQLKAEFETGVKNFLASPTFATIHLSASSMAIAVLLVLRLV
jgi:hypothetical protein